MTEAQRRSRVMGLAFGNLLLTAVHHAYGAYLYDTPWRLHIVPAALAAAVVIGLSGAVLRRNREGVADTVAFGIWCVALIFPFGMIGFVEGGYNHVLKDLLYFEGASSEVMRALFPAPVYEMPNDFFFEFTGVLQLVPAVLGARDLLALARERQAAARANSRSDASWDPRRRAS